MTSMVKVKDEDEIIPTPEQWIAIKWLFVDPEDTELVSDGGPQVP